MDLNEAKQNEIVLLNELLLNAQHSYYVLSAPIMADAIYDLKERDLRAMIADAPQFAELATALIKVGSDLTEVSGRVKHQHAMLSLENQYTFEEVVSWCEQFPPDTMFVLEPKIDGNALSCHYNKRKLVRAVTRGTGTEGEDVTKAMVASGAIEVELSEEFYPETPIEVRGEVFISKSQFDKLNEGQEKKYASPRNLASGSMKLQDLEAVKARGLRFYPWQVDGVPADYLKKKGLSADIAHHQTQYFALTTTKNYALDFSVFTDPELLTKALDTYLRAYRETTMHVGRGILTDGYVIKVANTKLRGEAGEGSKFPNWSCAYKYQSLQGVTSIIGISWQVGRTGKLTPVGDVEPVNLGGAIITKVNLNNWSWIGRGSAGSQV